jgi:phage baseplate assembly protein W
MSFPAVTGYVASIWTALRGTLVYFAANVSTTNTSATQSLAGVCGQTMANGRDAINMNDLLNGMTQAYINLAPILTLSLPLDPQTLGFVTARIDTLQAAILALEPLPPTPSMPAATIPNGQPAIPDPGLTEWMFQFSYETPPVNLTAVNFEVQAQAAANAWTTLAMTLQTAGVAYSGSTLDAVNWMGSAAQQAANDVSNVSINPLYSLTQAWNQLIALPSCARYSENITNDPTTAASQQSSVIRYIAGQQYIQFETLQLQLEEQAPSQVQLTPVRVGDTLMDIANRVMGNFEQWYSIAQFNGLVPPFISPTGGVNVAKPGDRLYIPSATSTTTVSTQPSYTVNYLGVDLYYGPINQEMIPWGGDFETIAGYQNLAISIGRRLQTTITTLIYHNAYGSRIPPEVGQPINSATSGNIQAYAQSAILSDPRVNSITSITMTLQTSYAISIEATVLPNGYGATSVLVNEVLQPG